LTASLKEAKNAIEKTLAELLRERQVRQETEKERVQAVKKVEEIQGHLENLEKIWDEERAQWKELWQRERSGWENQKTEFSAWEQKLRKERERFHEDMKVKEEAELKFASDLAQTLRNSAEASSKINALVRRFGGVASGHDQDAGARRIRGGLKAAAIAGGLALAAYPVFRYFTEFHFRRVETVPVAMSSPTALTFDGTLLWVAQWDGELSALDPRKPSSVIKSVSVLATLPYRPVAIAFGGNFLWTLDSAQGRLLRHSAADPAKVLYQTPAPGPAPTALAYDGKFLWSYDAANLMLYRHGVPESGFDAYSFVPDIVPTAMAWVAGDLWAFNSKSHELIVLGLNGRDFAVKGRYSLDENVIALAPIPGLNSNSKRSVWILAGPNARRSSNALIEYSY
jgi:hypothetical protein